MDTSNNKTSVLVNTQVPAFVRDEHQTFVQFLEYYYKFLEQDGELSYVTKNLMNFLNSDIIAADIAGDALLGEAHGDRQDGSYHVFLQKLYDNFIKLIPDNLTADRNLILKHAKDFYRSRGSEKSLRFLFRALYNKEITFYYPKEDILRASDGKWFVEKSLKITDITVNNVSNSIALTNFASKTIYGRTSNASAVVETVDSYFDKGELVTEIKLSNEKRIFTAGETIYTYFTEEGQEKLLQANIFSGIVTSVSVANAGSGYVTGDTVPLEGGGGTGALATIAQTSKGVLRTIEVSFGGAGFQVNDAILITGGGGAGATAKVSGVDKSGAVHPNTYAIVGSTISLVQSDVIGSSYYANLNPSIIDPANDKISNSMSYWAFSNCGPVSVAMVTNTGNNYIELPTLDITPNNVIRSFGIIGRLQINSGGSGYKIGDMIEFLNPSGSYGVGASAKVSSVGPSNTITGVVLVQQTGHFLGGFGYSKTAFPTLNVSSTTGTGANIAVNCLLGDGEILVPKSSTIGAIQRITVISGGQNYTSAPYANLTSMGDGTAQANVFIVTGTYTYPGRFLNDDGFLSSYNFLQDRDYYQNYSYVIKVDESINKYRKTMTDLVHPAGMKMFGEYMYINEETIDKNNVSVAETTVTLTVP